MELLITSTDSIATQDGVPARIWRGADAAGHEYEVHVQRIAARDAVGNAALAAELRKAPPISPPERSLPAGIDEEQAVGEMGEALCRLKERCPGGFIWHAEVGALVAVIATIQLALRHPRYIGETAQLARGIVDCWIETIAVYEPRLAEILRWGDDPNSDVIHPPGT